MFNTQTVKDTGAINQTYISLTGSLNDFLLLGKSKERSGLFITSDNNMLCHCPSFASH